MFETLWNHMWQIIRFENSFVLFLLRTKKHIIMFVYLTISYLLFIRMYIFLNDQLINLNFCDKSYTKSIILNITWQHPLNNDIFIFLVFHIIIFCFSKNRKKDLSLAHLQNTICSKQHPSFIKVFAIIQNYLFLQH